MGLVSLDQNVRWTVPVGHGVKVVQTCANVTGQQRTLATLKMENVFVKLDILEITVQKDAKMVNGAPDVNISAIVEVTIVTKKMVNADVLRAIWVQIVK